MPAAWAGDCGDTAVAAVAEDGPGPLYQVGDGVSGYDDVVAVSGPAATCLDYGAVRCVDDDLRVDAAAVVFADRGERLVVDRDQGAVNDLRAVMTVGTWLRCLCQHRYQVVDDAVHGGLAGGNQCGQGTGGQVGGQVNQYQQQPNGQRQPPGAPAARRGESMPGEREHGVELVGG